MTLFGRGTEFQEDPFNYLDGAPKICPPLDITDTDYDEEASTVEQDTVPNSQIEATTSQVEVPVPSSTTTVPPWQPQVKSRSKVTFVDKVTDISITQGFLPENKDSLHNTGIPEAYAIHRSGTSGKGRSLYMCPFGDQCSSPPYVSDIGSMGSHICHHHLGHCVQCPYESNQFYDGTGWQDHMSSKHESVPWYRSQLRVSSNLPTSFFKVATPVAAPSSTISTISDSSTTLSTAPSEATIPVSAPLVLDVPETEILEYVPNAEDINKPEPEPSAARQGIDIDSLTVADLKEITRLSLIDHQQYSYFWGGCWLGRHQ